MSHDVLDGLRRRLVSPHRAELDERRQSGAEGNPPGAVLADGGDRRDDDGDDAHLRDLPDGAGCTEIWEHLSERQTESRPEDGRAGECQADD